MREENKTYITHLKVTDVPWHRLTTAYGRGTEFPAHLAVLEQMGDLASVKESLYELTANMEHQSTLWHATPFGMVFLSRILEKALQKSGQNPVAHFLAGELLDFFPASSSASTMEMRWSTPSRCRCSLICSVKNTCGRRNTTRKKMRCATRRTRFSRMTYFTASITIPGRRCWPTGIYWSRFRKSLPGPAAAVLKLL